MDLFEYNLNYVQAAVLELKKYLLSQELFWPLHLHTPTGQSPYPKLTIGNLLFYLKRAEASFQGLAEETQFSRAEDELHVIATTWRTAWEKKAHQEFTSRLRQWLNYLQDQSRGESLGSYRTEIKLRVLLNLLASELPSELSAELDTFDQRLRAKFKSGDFIWDEAYADGFSKETYWYLYGKLT